MASVHMPLPELAAWVAIIVELVGGILLLIGYQTRWVALVLAIWCVITGVAVHLPAGDQANMIHFFKNLVMAGGFLFVVAHGAGGLSVDGAMGTDKAA
jgi:putative oxidoreductase